MIESSKLAVVVAAGGTAGHVRPALAVGEALRARGVNVTFAGSPDRVESQLVPEAGFELDTFAIGGFPRAPSVGTAAGALARRRRRPSPAGRSCSGAGRTSFSAAAAMWPARWCWPHACRGSRPHSQRPTRTSASPTGWRRRSPRSSFSPTTSRGARAARPRSSAGRSRSRISAPTVPRPARRFGLDLRARRWRVFGALAGATSLNEMAVAAWGDDGPAVLHVSGERDFAALRPRVARADYVLMAQTDHFGRRPRGGRHRRLPRRRDGLGARRRRDSVDSRPVSLRHRRPPDPQRPSLRARRRCGRRAECRDRERARARRGAAGRPGEARGDAQRRCSSMARVDAADRIAEGVIALARRADGASGGAAALLRRDRRVRHVRLRERRPRAWRRGARVGRPRHDLHRLARGDRRRPRGRACSAARVGDDRLDRTCASDRGHSAGGVPRGARGGAARDRGRRSPRQDDDGGDDRLRARARPAAIRPGSSVASCRSSEATPESARAGSSSRATSPTARSGRSLPRSR